jgi:hypothetical protein
VFIITTPGIPLVDRGTIFIQLDNHLKGLGGTYGSVTAVSAAGLFSAAHQTIPEQNFVATQAGYGAVQSRYLMNPGDPGCNVDPTTNQRVVVDIVTYLIPQAEIATYIYNKTF